MKEVKKPQCRFCPGSALRHSRTRGRTDQLMKRLGTRPVRCRSCSRRFYLCKGSSHGFIPAGIVWPYTFASRAPRAALRTARRRVVSAPNRSLPRQPLRRPTSRPSRPQPAFQPHRSVAFSPPVSVSPPLAVSPPVRFVKPIESPSETQLQSQLQQFKPQSSFSNFEEIDKIAEFFARVPLGGRIALWMMSAYLSALPIDWIIGGYEIDYWWSKRTSYCLLALLIYFVCALGRLIFSLGKTLTRLGFCVRTKFFSTRNAAR